MTIGLPRMSQKTPRATTPVKLLNLLDIEHGVSLRSAAPNNNMSQLQAASEARDFVCIKIIVNPYDLLD